MKRCLIHESLGKCKPKPHWDVISCLVNKAVIRNTRDKSGQECGEKCTVGGIIN